MTEFEKEQTKRKIKNTVNGTVEWVKDHPLETAVIISAGVGIGTSISRNMRRRQISRMEKVRMRSVYDPHTGMTWKIKRPLSNYEKNYILQQNRMGWSYYDSLKSLGVLGK